VKEFDNIRYRRMKKVLMGHEEQNITNTNFNQSNEVINMDLDSTNSTQNEIIVRLVLLSFLKYFM
jgi:hypothetical protein